MAFDAGFYGRRSVLFDASSDASSTFTSQAHWMGDYRIISVELPVTLNSGVTLEGTNDDGHAVALNTIPSGGTWSTLTRITNAGIYSIDPGFAWIRARRQSNDSQAPVIIQARS